MFTINTSAFYRIWYSTHPNIFLGFHNQLRFIQLRTNNPDARLSFVYSSKRLTKKSIEELHQFCEQYRIRAIDFDTDIPKWLQTEFDKKLWKQAAIELEHKFGNIGSASDLTRIIYAVIKELGIYAELDLDIQFNKIKSQSVKAPLVLDARFDPDIGIVYFNAHFLALSVEPKNPEVITQKAINALHLVQKIVVERYESALFDAVFREKTIGSGTVALRNPYIIALLKKFCNEKPKASIYDFKEHLSQIDTAFEIICVENGCTKRYKYDLTTIAKVKDLVTSESVTLFSGGEVFSILFDRQNINNLLHIGMPALDPAIQQKVSQETALSMGIPGNGLDKHIKLSSINGKTNRFSLANINITDASWKNNGRIALQAKDATIARSARQILGYFQKNRGKMHIEKAHFMMIERIQSIIKKDSQHFKPLMNSLNNRAYNQALRRLANSAHAQSYSAMETLLDYQKSLNIDVNQEGSEPHTSPLYYAEKQKDQLKCDLLKRHGARHRQVASPH